MKVKFFIFVIAICAMLSAHAQNARYIVQRFANGSYGNYICIEGTYSMHIASGYIVFTGNKGNVISDEIVNYPDFHMLEKLPADDEGKTPQEETDTTPPVDLSVETAVVRNNLQVEVSGSRAVFSSLVPIRYLMVSDVLGTTVSKPQSYGNTTVMYLPKGTYFARSDQGTVKFIVNGYPGSTVFGTVDDKVKVVATKADAGGYFLRIALKSGPTHYSEVNGIIVKNETGVLTGLNYISIYRDSDNLRVFSAGPMDIRQISIVSSE